MNPIEKTIRATFKGVPFLVRRETNTSGRKVAIHEYPGSDVRFIEDLGKKPGIFRVSGYISGENWVQDTQRLSTALDESSEGILELSTFGRFKVKSVEYTKESIQTSLGEVSFNLTFFVSTPNPSPAIAVNSVQTVAGAVVKIMDILQGIFSSLFIAPTLADTAKASSYDGTQMVTEIGDEIKDLGLDVDSITEKVNSVLDNIADLVRDPVGYAAELFNDGLLGEVSDTVGPTISKDTLNTLSRLCRVGFNLVTDFESIKDELLSNAARSFNIPLFDANTVYRVRSNSNRNVLVSSIRTSLFGIYMEQAANADYSTDSDISDVVADIDDIYNNVILVDGTDPLVALAVDQCRVAALDVLEGKVQTTPKVVDFDLKVSTVDVELAYRLYAEDFTEPDDLETKATVLTELNGILPTRYLAGADIKVLKI